MSAEKSGYAVTIASGDALDVREFTVRERMSALFSVEITAVSDNPDVEFETAVGRQASFEARNAITEDAPSRIWTGVCRELHQLRVEETGLSTYSIEIVPALWLATQRRNYRMFQGMSDVDIAVQLLSEWGAPPVQQLSATYRKRKYRVQYGESDYAFICRLLEDAGVSFYFAAVGGQSMLVLSDAPHANPPREPKITFRDTPTDADREHVTAVRVRRQIRPGRVTLRDHDYRRPPGYKLLGAANLGSGVEDQLEQYHYMPGAFLFESDRGDPTPHADDRGRYRTDEGEAAAMARRQLDAGRSEMLSCTFATNAIDLAPGVVFAMTHHPRRDLGEDRGLLVVETTLHGKFGEGSRHHCEARSADVPYRPTPATPRPRIMGVESATVVGPQGEEIHTDEFGRVRIHFHWDRESKMDENSSCWIHVSQGWGGAGYGGVNLPRIGQEVLVDFLGGDPDRPIITGRVYTNLQKVPYKLPDNRTQSGWKSNSTTGTGGYNEVMFEDAAGKELLHTQAEKDQTQLVKNDESCTVGRDRTRVVKRNESITIGKNRTKQVVQTERVTIGQNQSITVGVNRSVQIGSIDSTTVGNTHVVMISPQGEGGTPPRSSSITMTDKKIVLDTGAGATIVMDHDKITITADDLVEIFGKKRGVNVHASGPGGKTNFFTGDSFVVACKTVAIAGNTVGIAAVGENNISGGLVSINGPGLPAGRVTDLAVATITIGSSTVFIGGAPTPREITRDAKTGELCYGKGIKIGGDAAYQSRALAAVCRLDGTPTMHAAYDDLEKSGHTETLQPYVNPKDPFNATCTPTNAAGASQKGVGSDSVVNWDPDVHGFGPPGTTPDSEQPGSDIILAHEMIHGTHDATGTAGTGPFNGDSVNTSEERNTVGLPARTYNNPNNPSDPLNGTALPDTTGGPYTENKVRQDYANQGRLSPVTGKPPVQRPSYYDPKKDGSAGDPL